MLGSRKTILDEATEYTISYVSSKTYFKHQATLKCFKNILIEIMEE